MQNNFLAFDIINELDIDLYLMEESMDTSTNNCLTELLYTELNNNLIDLLVELQFELEIIQ